MGQGGSVALPPQTAPPEPSSPLSKAVPAAQSARSIGIAQVEELRTLLSSGKLKSLYPQIAIVMRRLSYKVIGTDVAPDLATKAWCYDYGLSEVGICPKCMGTHRRDLLKATPIIKPGSACLDSQDNLIWLCEPCVLASTNTTWPIPLALWESIIDARNRVRAQMPDTSYLKRLEPLSSGHVISGGVAYWYVGQDYRAVG